MAMAGAGTRRCRELERRDEVAVSLCCEHQRRMGNTVMGLDSKEGLPGAGAGGAELADGWWLGNSSIRAYAKGDKEEGEVKEMQENIVHVVGQESVDGSHMTRRIWLWHRQWCFEEIPSIRREGAGNMESVSTRK